MVDRLCNDTLHSQQSTKDNQVQFAEAELFITRSGY